jgi:uncharacterized protein (TIGR03085 family)
MSSFVRAERAALADLLLRLGPDAPTLCAGWTTADLAAHLVSRERRPDTLPGIGLARFNGWTEKVRLATKDRPWPVLVEAVRSGPALPNPLALTVVDAAVNNTEYFIHHEDVRRAQDGWEPRVLDPQRQRGLWKGLRMAPLMLRSVTTGVRLTSPGFGEIAGHKGEPPVLVTGEPGELVLFCSGRQDHARVRLDGDPDAATRLRAADLGM